MEHQESGTYQHSETKRKRLMSDVQYSMLPKADRKLWQAVNPDEEESEEDEDEDQKPPVDLELEELRTLYKAETGKDAGRKQKSTLERELKEINDEKLNNKGVIPLDSLNPTPEEEGE